MIGWVVGPELLLFLFNVRDVVGQAKINKKQKEKKKRVSQISEFGVYS